MYLCSTSSLPYPYNTSTYGYIPYVRTYRYWCYSKLVIDNDYFIRQYFYRMRVLVYRILCVHRLSAVVAAHKAGVQIRT